MGVLGVMCSVPSARLGMSRLVGDSRWPQSTLNRGLNFSKNFIKISLFECGRRVDMGSKDEPVKCGVVVEARRVLFEWTQPPGSRAPMAPVPI